MHVNACKVELSPWCCNYNFIMMLECTDFMSLVAVLLLGSSRLSFSYRLEDFLLQALVLVSPPSVFLETNVFSLYRLIISFPPLLWGESLQQRWPEDRTLGNHDVQEVVKGETSHERFTGGPRSKKITRKQNKRNPTEQSFKEAVMRTKM